MTNRQKTLLFCIMTLIVFLLSFAVGRYSVSPFTAVKILLSKIFPVVQSWTNAQYSVVINIRLPRILCAALIGAALSVAGSAFQGMFGNPMVSPDILGASSGAGFGAALAILAGFSYFGITVLSFVFGLVAVFLAFVISKASKIQSALALVLSGVLIQSVFQSGTSFIKLVADTESQLPEITYWLMGSLTACDFKDFTFALIPVCIGMIPILFLRWKINLLTVSEEEAMSMGINTSLIRLIVIICASLITSASVAISGLIGWIGLLIPHFCRLIFGQDYRHIIPSSAVLGAGYMMLVDDISRSFASFEIPLGILTALVGAPLFVYLIIRGGHNENRG